MLFIVSRTSMVFNDNPPCEEAKRVKITHVDERTVDDPAKLLGRIAEEWYQGGENHRVENGHIKRDFPDCEVWGIEIPDLESLIAFTRKYDGRIVFEVAYDNPDYMEVEIYDYWRE